MNELYAEDSYLKECEATVVEVKEGKYIILDKTIFYPRSGGQPHDTGVMKRGDEVFNVVFVGKFSGAISHEVDTVGLQVGDIVHCAIDWERRYTLMRMHTSTHVLCEVIHRDTGALITGNQLDIDKSRIDFSLEQFNPDQFQQFIKEANQKLAEDLKVSISFLPREEAMKLPQVSKLAKGLPETLKTLRIVNIGDFDVQADGGTHVASTKEVGSIKMLKLDNKGKNNRRLYFTLEKNDG